MLKGQILAKLDDTTLQTQLPAPGRADEGRLTYKARRPGEYRASATQAKIAQARLAWRSGYLAQTVLGQERSR
jgi:hypothetical protein